MSRDDREARAAREAREPTPAHGDDVPDAVLDELRQAFTGPHPVSGRGGAADTTGIADPTSDFTADFTSDFTIDDLTLGDLTLDDLPAADLDDLHDLSPDASGSALITGEDDSLFTDAWVVAVPDVPGTTDPDPPAGPPVAGRRGVANGRGAGGQGSEAPQRATPARQTIVIGGDDSLPDAVYVDDGDISSAARGETLHSDRMTVAAGAAGDRGTIVIGDELEASGAFDAVTVPSRSMDPRVRARRVAVKRAQGRKRLLLVAGIGGAVVLVVAVLAVFSSSLFAVERVDVQGAPYTRERYGDRLQAVIDDLLGEPVLIVDTTAAEAALESLPWIERAFVSTDFPDRVLIDVRERQPLATFEGSDGRYRVIDRDGYVLDVLAGRPADYMLIAGIGPDLEPASSAGSSYAAAAQLVGALPAEIRDLTLGATLDPTTGDLGLSIQVVPVADPDAVAEGAAESAGDQEPVLVDVRIGSFNGVDSKLARLLQVVRDGIGDATSLDVSTDDVIG